ncbi:MAG: glucose 1-dehydrogenase [Bacteroidetes bacterium]|nr:glucose 1-dehydrogenase [Bacteroidota bacterium]MDE2670989.1 glucose 1-dehydrogenase [Bacteroidota bacterium]
MAVTAKHVVVTGGAKGIGGAVVTRFLEEGASVTVLDLDEKRARERLVNFEDRSLFIHCDVSKADQVEGAFNQVDTRFGAVDVLVNNAGIQRYSTVTDTTEEEWDLVMNVNLKSAFLCSKYAIPLMQKRGKGVVINVASVQSFITQRKVAPYTTSKTAMLGLTRSIAVDYAPDIRAVAICPGTVDTPMLRWAANQSPDPEEVYREVREMHLTQRIAEPVEIADLIFYLSSDTAAFITGQAIRIDGGLGLVVAGSVRQ